MYYSYSYETMRKAIKEKVKSGVSKIAKPFKGDKEEKRPSRVTEGVATVIEENKFEESEEYKRKKEKAARMR